MWYYRYPAFDASKTNFFSTKPSPSSPQYDRSNSKLLQKHRQDKTSDLLHKGKEVAKRTTSNAVRRTSIAVGNTLNSLRQSLTSTPKADTEYKQVK